MINELSKEELAEINRQLQRERASKGGRKLWAGLTAEEKAEKMKAIWQGRRDKAAAARNAKKT